MKNRIKTILILLAILLCSASSMDAGKVTLSVDNPRGKSAIGVEDLFYINITLENVDADVKMPTSVPGCKVNFFNRNSINTSSVIVNGKREQSVVTNYCITLKALQEGTYSFGPLTIGGVKSNTVKYTIGPKGSGSTSVKNPSPNNTNGPQLVEKGGSELFVKAYLSKTSAYEQEALVYTIKLYTTYEGVFSNIATASPTFKDFVFEKTNEIDRSFNIETYNGKSYKTAVIDKFIVFPQKSGKLSIQGNTYTMTLEQKNVYNDPFFGTFSHSVPVQLEATPNDVEVDVKPLPLPQPINFTGAVGQFSISSSLPNSSMVANQVATITYTVEGKGNLKYIKLPDLSSIYPKQFKVYSSSNSSECEPVAGNMVGKTIFENVIMPLESGNYHLPELEFVYFDPTTSEYKSTTAKGYAVTVEPGKTSNDLNQNMAAKQVDTNLLNAVNSDNNIELLIESLLYWLIYLLPTILLIIVILFYKRHLKNIANVEMLKIKKANKVAQQRLKKAYMCLKKNKPEQFYDEMLLALWGYISDKLSMPTSDLNRDNIKYELLKYGDVEREVDCLITLLDECEYAKYASTMISAENMKSAYENGVQIINSLNDKIKKKDR